MVYNGTAYEVKWSAQRDLVAVSYTHLDVYKRQEHGSWNACIQQNIRSRKESLYLL